MHKHVLRILSLALLAALFSQCSNNNSHSEAAKIQTGDRTDPRKILPGDPFKSTIVPSQQYEIDAKRDNVIEGSSGTVMVFPKGCFRNTKGEVVNGNVKIELSEALVLDDMLLSNLTTTSNGKPLETDGMIYFNATINGEQLTVNKDNPVHIEIPTPMRKPGMMAYKGTRDEKGNMNWTDPKELDNYLVPVDINLLDFLPEGFGTEVDKEVATRKVHKEYSDSYADSLYYSLSASDGSELLKGLVPTNYNEPYYNKSSKVVNGKYTPQSYSVDATADTAKKDTTCSNCGIDPAIIKVIKSKKYQNTLIATREFETRLKLIFRTCRNSVLEIYIKNLDKNLYELDSLASLAAGNVNDYSHAFTMFSQQRLTKVKNADKYALLLNGYYEKQLIKVKSELKEAKEKLMKSLEKKNEETRKLADDYKKLLLKREKYRMETYGFNWTQTGWINIDNGTIPKTWGMEPLEVKVENGNGFDRVYTYVVYTSIKSLYRCNSSDNEEFYVGNDEEKQMLMPKKETGVIFSIGYKDKAIFCTTKEFVTGVETKLSVTLSPSTIENFREMIQPYEKYKQENHISKDLEFMDAFYKEQLRQQALKKDSKFIQHLRDISYPCCIPGPQSRLENVP